uniref:Putative methyltransferase NSUN6 isoform X2 n=1 Tax=Rhizophora mucronata TaxID=61149 RepID=A0A2P2KZY4_RHIMU
MLFNTLPPRIVGTKRQKNNKTLIPNLFEINHVVKFFVVISFFHQLDLAGDITCSKSSLGKNF